MTSCPVSSSSNTMPRPSQCGQADDRDSRSPSPMLLRVIVRQMLRRITIIESGDADLLPGMLAERGRFEDENRRVLAEGGKPASGRPELMGITKASLATRNPRAARAVAMNE